jgi:hypothetical protein
MEIPLAGFEQLIDEVILKRGLQYFKKGLVNDPEEIGHGEFEAIVEGTEPYTVRLTVKNEVLTEYVCSCPYDMGPVCKHVAAVIFHLLQDDLNLKTRSKKVTGEGKKNGQEKKTSKKKTIAEQVDEILGKISHDDLKAYIRDQCEKDRDFRRLFIARYAGLFMADSKELYAGQIKAVLKAAAGRQGFIGYAEASAVGSLVDEMVERARNLADNSGYSSSMYIACAVIEEMTKALDYGDDSNGDFGGPIQSSMEVLFSIAEKPLPEELRKEFFDYCAGYFRSGAFKGWDWHFSMLSIAATLATNPDEIKLIQSLIDTIKPSKKEWDWDFDEACKIKLELIRKTEGTEEATRYMEQNIAISDFRKELIQQAIQNKDYQKAIALAQEGIKKDEKSLPGLADDWRNCLLEVYTKLNDTENIINLARYLFLNSRREPERYFTILKKHVHKNEWKEFVEQLIQSVIKQDRYIDYSTLAQIYIWEEHWDRLLEIVKKNVSFSWLDTYEKYLVKDYAVEIADMYQNAVLKYMAENMGRNHYQTVCRYLRKMIKMGAREKADYAIQQFRTLYPMRKALMEELEKV